MQLMSLKWGLEDATSVNPAAGGVPSQTAVPTPEPPETLYMVERIARADRKLRPPVVITVSWPLRVPAIVTWLTVPDRFRPVISTPVTVVIPTAAAISEPVKVLVQLANGF